jgi:hypothetical protein
MFKFKITLRAAGNKIVAEQEEFCGLRKNKSITLKARRMFHMCARELFLEALSVLESQVPIFVVLKLSY